MNSNRTFTMLKPDSIEQGNMLPILNMIESSGFKIIALKYKRMSKDEAEKFYSIHSGKSFFNKVRDGYLAIASENKDYIKVIDASNDIDTINKSIINSVLEIL